MRRKNQVPPNRNAKPAQAVVKTALATLKAHADAAAAGKPVGEAELYAFMSAAVVAVQDVLALAEFGGYVLKSTMRQYSDQLDALRKSREGY